MGVNVAEMVVSWGHRYLLQKPPGGNPCCVTESQQAPELPRKVTRLLCIVHSTGMRDASSQCFGSRFQ